MPFIGKQSTSNSQITSYTTTVGSGGQTNFTVIIEGGDETHVYLNGVLLKETTDYTVSSTQVSLVTPAVENDIVEIKVFRSFALADAVRASEGGTFSGNVAVTGDLTVDTDTLKVDSTNEKVGINKTPATEFHAGGVIQLEDKAFAGGYTRTSSLVNINIGDDSTYASTTAMLQIKNLGNRGAKGHASGSDLLRGDFSDANGFVFDKSGNLDITGSYNSGTIGSSVVFPDGHIVQVKASQTSSQSAVSVSTTPTALGLSVSIEPTSSSNTIIVHGCVFMGQSNFNGGCGIGRHLTSDAFSDSATRIGPTDGTMDTSFQRIGNFYNADEPYSTAIYGIFPIPFTYFDNSYSTTNSITYTVYGEASTSETYYFNMPSNGTPSGRTTSFIWAYEVKGSVT